MTQVKSNPSLLTLCLMLVASVCLLVGLPTNLCAATDNSTENTAIKAGTDLSELSLEDLMNIQVFTASKKAQALWKTPAAVYVITREDIQNYGYQTLAAALQQVTGIYQTNDRVYQRLGVRGFAPPDDYSTRVLLLINGHRVNDPLSATAPIGEDFPVDMQSIQRIEVVKGPGSALWGTNALLAVINVITRKGSDVIGTNVAIDSRARTFVEYGNTFDSGLDITGSYSTLNTDGQNDVYFKEFDDATTNNGHAVGSDGTKATRGYLHASYGGFGFTLNSGDRNRDIPPGYWGTPFVNTGNYTYDQRTSAELTYNRKVSKKHNGDLMWRAYRNNYNYNSESTWDPGGVVPSLVSNQDMLAVDWWGTELRYSRDIGSKASTVVGAEYLDSYRMRQENHDVDPYTSYVDSSSKSNSRSFYAQADYQPVTKITTTLGVRYDKYSNCGANWSPRAAMVYAPNSGTSIKLLYGQAFFAPSPDVFEIPGYSVVNPNLRPETIATTELVWEQHLGRQSYLQVSAYRFNMEGLIQRVTIPGGELQYQNLGQARSSGIEAQLRSRSSNGATNYFGVSYSNATELPLGNRLTNAPSWLISGGMSIPVFSGRASISPTVRYATSRRTTTGNETTAPLVFDVALVTNKISRDYDVSLSMYNMFNESEFMPSSGSSTQDTFPQDGRSVILQVTYRQ